jgi:hypothetical protein
MLLLKELAEFLDGKASLPDKRSKSSPGKLTMIGDGETSIGRVWVSEGDVAAGLMVELKTNFLESPDGITTRYGGQSSHKARG